MVRKNAHQAANGWNAWSFDDWSLENLKNYLLSTGDAAYKKTADSAGATRDELVKAAGSAYASASSAGGVNFASATSYLTQATDTAKRSIFENWSESELKAYLDSYGIPVPQGSTINELRAYARKQYTFFRYGTTTPTETIFAKLGENVKESFQWVMDQINTGAEVAKKKAAEINAKAKEEL
jgi:hypothetical protein